MADKQIPEILPDLPEDWGYGQTVAPEGPEVGLSEQHGYNYLMKKVNAVARAINEIYQEMGQIVPADMVTAKGGGELILPEVLGEGPYVLEFTEEETEEYALKADLSQYAALLNPIFSKCIVIGGNAWDHEGDPGDSAHGAIIAGTLNRSNAHSSVTVGVENENFSAYNLVIGYANKANNLNASCIGYHAQSHGNYSLATGFYTIAKYLELVAGKYNVATETATFDEGNLFILGNGDSESIRNNAFRVSKHGDTFGGAYHSSGADYAEVYEWLDGNPNAEDRAGRFVVLDGEKIRLAEPEDDPRDILGIVSGNPSVVGDSHNDQWRGMYERDIFGRLIYENVEIKDPENPGQTVTERRRKRNPAYDPAQRYIPQSKRPEKSAIGLVGKLVLIDNGTCEVNGWCAVGPAGTAVKSETRNRFRVMSRLDDTHVRVNIMLQ